MIIYKSAAGDGFNPLLAFATRLKAPLRLRPLTRRSQIIASINLLMSILLLLLSSFWITGIWFPDVRHFAFSTTVVIAWRLVSYIALRREQLQVATIPELRIFRFNLFTAEWFLFYLSLSLYLMSIQTMAIHKLLHVALVTLATLSIAMMLVPLAQGSHQALKERR